SADVAIGSARTYAYIDTEMDFTYQTWMDSIRKANTFVTCGPLMEFSVEGKPPGSRIKMSSRGGTVNISWKTASVTMPMTKVELIINGDVLDDHLLVCGYGNARSYAYDCANFGELMSI
ncbi:unnamed protein product, partial [marine sediment metagenome]